MKSEVLGFWACANCLDIRDGAGQYQVTIVARDCTEAAVLSRTPGSTNETLDCMCPLIGHECCFRP